MIENLTLQNYDAYLIADEITEDVGNLNVPDSVKDQIVDLIFKYLDRSTIIRQELAQG